MPRKYELGPKPYTRADQLRDEIRSLEVRLSANDNGDRYIMRVHNSLRRQVREKKDELAELEAGGA